ncbi:MAG TPA: DUF1801 domain-containing protein [Puia sp.]|jgi:hypothetical protein|nr:DUF1801 domain-containing protein [Puia sp.]
MAKNKTVETKNSVGDYLKAIKDEKRRKDCSAIIKMISEHTGFEAKMWGTSIVGFGIYHYKYESGRKGDAPLVGIASRSNAITLYLASNFGEKEKLLLEFGKYKTGRGCIYIQKLEDIHTDILIKMVNNSIQYYKKLYPG